MNMARRDFKTIVFAGSHSHEKSEAIIEMKRRLEGINYTVYIQNQITTDLFPPEIKIDLSLTRENCYVRAVKRSIAKKKIIFFDRGIMDDLPDTGSKLFDQILKSHGLSRVDVRDRRYDAIFYFRKSVCHKDKKTLAAWIGHRHLRVIPVFRDKQARFNLLWKHIQRVLGIPKPLEIERKFLVEILKNSLPTAHVSLNVVQNYLKKELDGSSPRIRLVADCGFLSTHLMYKTVKKKVSKLSREEQEIELSQKSYERLSRNIDLDTVSIIKRRTYFVYANQYFELDEFFKPYNNLVLLEIELLR